MSKTISFSVTEDEYRLITAEAKARGLSAAQLAKTSLFSHMNKYPTKGAIAELHEMTAVHHARPTFAGSESDSQGVTNG